MVYLNAFLVAGILCVLCQLLLMFTKLGVPKILVLCLAIGSILTAIGLMDKLIGLGTAGVIIMVLAAGQPIYLSTMAALQGNFMGFALFLLTVLGVVVIGILSALIYLAINTKAENTIAPPKGVKK